MRNPLPYIVSFFLLIMILSVFVGRALYYHAHDDRPYRSVVRQEGLRRLYKRFQE